MSSENDSQNSPAPRNIAYFSDGNVLRDLGRFEGRLDAHDREISDCKQDLRKLKDAVSKLQEWKAFIIGGAAVVAGIASWLTTVFMKSS